MPGYYGASAPAEPGTNRARRPNLVQSMFDQTVAGPAAGYQNPGAILPGIAGDAQPVAGVSDDQRNAFLQSTGGDNLPAPGFASPPVTGQTAMTQPGQLNALARGGLFSGGSGPPQQPASGSPPPAIFNGGAAASPSDTLPISASPNGLPAGYRRMMMTDGSPGAYQQILPGERTANGQDAMRQGTSMAEIQQANPGMSATQLLQLHTQMQRASGINQVQNLGLRNDAANMGQGLFTDAQRSGVGQYGVDPRTGGGSVGRGLAIQQQQTNFNTSQNRARDQIATGIIAQGGTADDVREGLAAFDASGSQSPAGQAPPGQTPASPTASVAAPGNDLHRTLDQHLQAAAGLPPQPTGRGPRMPLALPLTAKPEEANNALTNFVQSVASAGLLTPDNLPNIMSYMTQRFRAQNVDPWFQRRFGGLSGGTGTPHHAAAQTLQDVMRARGVDIGNTERPGRIGGSIGAFGGSIRNGLDAARQYLGL